MEQHRPVTLARNGLVSTPHYLASAAGLQILQAGGNAVDAAIAANAVLNVVYPILCGTGGDLFMLIWDARGDGLHALNAAGRTGSGATLDFFRSHGYSAMPQRGALTVSVPGCVDGWQMAHERFGRLTLAQCLQPAIHYAEDGFGVSEYLADRLAFVAEQDWCHESWRAVYAPNGRAPAPNSLFSVPELGRSLRLIGEQGRDVFYEGDIGRALADFLERQGGVVTHEDIATHHGAWVEPLAVDYRGYRIFELPPPTQGFVALQMLKLVEGFELGGDPAGAKNVHLLVEAKKAAFIDRAAHLADPAFMTVDPRTLLEAGHVAERRSRMSPAALAPDLAPSMRTGDTIYLCTADGDGNAVSLIQSNWMGVGAGMVLPGYGIELHNRGNYFSLDPNHVNCIAPHKQPFHTLIPSMAFRDGRPAIVLGTQGGDGQAQVHLQLYTKLIDYGWNIQATLEAPRWVHGRGQAGDPPGLLLENRFPEETVAGLAALGHQVELTVPWTPRTGQAQGIVIDPSTGLLAGGADPRADGWAAGW